jgi:hypothetical protein
MNLFEPVWPWQKPKGMHWRTFAKLTAQEERYNCASLLALLAWLEKERSSQPRHKADVRIGDASQ